MTINEQGLVLSVLSHKLAEAQRNLYEFNSIFTHFLERVNREGEMADVGTTSQSCRIGQQDSETAETYISPPEESCSG